MPPWGPGWLQVPGSRCYLLWLSWHRGGHVQLVDGSDLSYVEDGTPCGPGMLCLDRKCLPATAFNFSSCPGSWDGKICFDHGVRGAVGTGGHPGSVAVTGGDAVLSQVCSNEGKCICRAEWTGKDCSVYDPIPEPKPTGETERYKGPCARGDTGSLLSPDLTGWAVPLCPQPHRGSSVSPHPGAAAQLGMAGFAPLPGPCSSGSSLGLCPRVPASHPH